MADSTGDALSIGQTSTTIGVTGQRWRSSVTPWGAVIPWGTPVDAVEAHLDWYVAADDRWHVPRNERSVRQRRIDGTPVVETRVRVPDGDAVQRAWAVADQGGATVIEVENDSPLPIAVAFDGLEVVTDRPVSDVPIQGIELGPHAISLPIGHRSTVRVAIAHGRPIGAPRSLPDAEVVTRGWATVVGRASRFELPDSGLTEAVTAARCDLLLEGPVDPAEEPAGFVLDVGELVRLGEAASRWLPEIVAPLHRAASDRHAMSKDAAHAAHRIALAAGDARAARDARRLHDRLLAELGVGSVRSLSEVRRGASVGAFVCEIERFFVAATASEVQILPVGVPSAWYGANFEVHTLPTGVSSELSFAVRWHGARPAVLWEQGSGAALLTAPALDAAWSSDAARGEALLAAPRQPVTLGLVDQSAPEDDG